MRSSRHRTLRVLLIVGVLTALMAVPAIAAVVFDFGVSRDRQLTESADELFGGLGTPLAGTATPVTVGGADSVALASGLKVRDVLRGEVRGPADTRLYQNADMIAFWPSDDRPEWGIVCIENGPSAPGVQRIKLRGRDKGDVETILSGTQACDGIRRTPWDTILATEEVGGSATQAAGWALEIYDPLETSRVRFDRQTGEVSGEDAANVRPRPALGRFAWEGIAIYPNGTLYAGDELGPNNRANGGALFKFVSDRAPAASGPDLADPANHADSPFASGRLHALEVGGQGANRGQGNERGTGRWVGPIDAARARPEGIARGTGFYRPEDLHPDPLAAEDGRVRICWTNTGNADLGNYGEVLCLDDRADGAAPTGAIPEVQQFVAGNPAMNQPDNLEFQPRTGIVYVIEDTPRVNGVSRPGDIWACLPDGADQDLQSDGCVMAASVRTAGAEPTGFIFSGDGRRAYLNIQHSPDNPATTDIDEAGFDELLVLDGFRPGRR